MQLECMGGPLDGDVLPIPDDETAFIADPLIAGAPRARYVVRELWRHVGGAAPNVFVIEDALVFDDWVSD